MIPELRALIGLFHEACIWCNDSGVSLRGGYEHYCDCPAGLALNAAEQGPYDEED